jgi:hypothetical protein
MFPGLKHSMPELLKYFIDAKENSRNGRAVARHPVARIAPPAPAHHQRLVRASGEQLSYRGSNGATLLTIPLGHTLADDGTGGAVRATTQVGMHSKVGHGVDLAEGNVGGPQVV